MKKIIIILMACLLLLSVSLEMNCEERYLPILEVGKEWYFVGYQAKDELQDPDVLFEYRVTDIVEDNGHNVYILCKKGFEDYPIDPDVDYRYIRRAYEENGVLWYLSINEGVYLPVIDFNLEVGDKMDGGDEIVWKDSFIIEGVVRCVIGIKEPYSKKIYHWIEGIGAIEDCFLSSMAVPIGERFYMSECRMGDNVLFDYSRMDEYLASGVRTVGMTEDEEASLYDILGHRISAPVPGQLYIQDGKKHIAR